MGKRSLLVFGEELKYNMSAKNDPGSSHPPQLRTSQKAKGTTPFQEVKISTRRSTITQPRVSPTVKATCDWHSKCSR
jgi:hypothetical protein